MWKGKRRRLVGVADLRTRRDEGPYPRGGFDVLEEANMKTRKVGMVAGMAIALDA